jgi:hypothetical protein
MVWHKQYNKEILRWLFKSDQKWNRDHESGEFCDELQGLSKREGCFIVQNDHPFEVEVFGEVGSREKSVRMQFYVKEDGRCSV